MPSGVSRSLIVVLTVAAAVGAWVVAGHRVLSVSSVKLSQSERSVFSAEDITLDEVRIQKRFRFDR